MLTELEEVEEQISLLKAQNEEFDKRISNLEKHIEHVACKTRFNLDGMREVIRGVTEIVGTDKLKQRSQGEQQKNTLMKQALGGKDKQLYEEMSHCWQEASLSWHGGVPRNYNILYQLTTGITIQDAVWYLMLKLFLMFGRKEHYKVLCS